MKWLAILLYILAGIMMGCGTAAFFSLTHQGTISWPWVILCGTFWPATLAYVIGFFLYANFLS